MSQGQALAAQNKNAALQVYGEHHPALAPLRNQEIVAQVEHCLEGSELTFRHLLIDLGAYLAANPSIQQYVTPAGLYNCMIVAARHHTTFGDGGMWIVPEHDHLRPQESEKYITSRAGEAGYDIRVVLIHEHHKPVKVGRSDTGGITSFSISEADITVTASETNLVGAFGIAEHQETSQRRIEWFDVADLNRRKNHSAAVKKGGGTPMWTLDPLKGHERAVRAAMGRLLVPIRTRSPGKVGSMVAPFAGAVVDAEYKPVLEAGDAGSEITDALSAANYPVRVSAFASAAKVLESAAETGGIDALASAWQEHKKMWHEMLSPDQFMGIEGMKNDFKQQLTAASDPDPHPEQDRVYPPGPKTDSAVAELRNETSDVDNKTGAEGAKPDSEPSEAQGAPSPSTGPPDAQEDPKSETEAIVDMEALRPKFEALTDS